MAEGDALLRFASGAIHQTIYYPELKALHVCLPSPPEQKRIVAILDAAFEGIDTAIANTERNLANAGMLLDNQTRRIFNNGDGTWGQAKLGELCQIYQPRTISRKEMMPDGAYVVFGANGVIGRYDKFNHEASELLVTCRGATCGTVNVSTPKAWITGNAMVVRPKTSALNRDFLRHYFVGAADFSTIITGSAQPQITRQSFAPLTIPLPSIEEQVAIVKALDQLSNFREQLFAVYERKCELLRLLRKSLLQRAFTGGLTASTEAVLNETAVVAAE